MAKIMKNTIKAKQNRNRVNLHRAWKSIINTDQINREVNHRPSLFSNLNAPEHQINTNDSQNAQIRESLRRWALRFNISKRAVSDLLKILILFGINSLPSDSRSLLSTPRAVALKSLANGKIW